MFCNREPTGPGTLRHFRSKIHFPALYLQPMKLFALIMGIIVLAVSCMPCLGGAFCIKNEKAKIEVSKSGSHQDKEDNCSPFCICNCCAGFFINHSFTSINILQINNCRNFVSYLPENITKISLPVWEPPRL